MGTFNDMAEKLMDKLSDFADNKTEAKMLHLVNCVTMEVIAKVWLPQPVFAASSAVSFIDCLFSRQRSGCIWGGFRPAE